MTVKVLQAKISNAIITESSVKYKGSITIDPDILDEMGVLEWQVCDVNLKFEALFRLATVIFGFYKGAEEYLKGVSPSGRTG